MSEASSDLSSRQTRPRAYAAAVVAHRLRLHSTLGDEDLEVLDRLLGLPTPFKSGALIAAAGGPAEVVTVIQSGVVARTSVLSNGRRQIHSLFLRGETADAETPLLGLRVDNLEAIGRCSAWLLPKSRLAELVHTRPLLAEAFAREAAIAAQVAREWVVNIGRRTAVERIAHLFCEMHARLDALGMVYGDSFGQPLTQIDLADAQGLSAVHVNRVLQILRAKGLISTSKGRLAILDLPGLQRLGLFDPVYLHLEKSTAA